MRQRVRPAHDAAALASIYARPHEHAMFGPSHTSRVKITAGVADVLAPIGSVADLSCGDAWIAYHIGATGTKYLGDLAPGWEFTGPIEQTIAEIPHVDLFVISETIEHLDDPDMVLALIREKADRLLLSTPDSAWDDTNAEHYWAWDTDAVAEMLHATGWRFTALCRAGFRDYPYDYQIWAAI